eukprot:Seg8024.1 transcript_id=Seg8024.1/GoldUCD/mRNA.D3Y31 product="hypothetical protein" protein_id=Seg8024.1/GoldUCD/D3Y31
MVRLDSNLAALKAFGTHDGANVYKALKACFQRANHLLCWIHVKDNIKKKLSQLGAKDSRTYIKEIFGKKCGDIKIKGLLDVATAEQFEQEWCEIERKWIERGAIGAKFHKYVAEHKTELMKSSMIAGVREKCGLGNPPLEYTQNAKECSSTPINFLC